MPSRIWGGIRSRGEGMAADEGFWLGSDGWLADRCTETTKRMRRRRRMPEGARASTGRLSSSPHLFPARRQVGSHATAQLARPALRACNSRCTAAAILAPSAATGDALKHGTAVRTHICKHAVIHRPPSPPTTQGPDPTNQQEPNSHDQTEVWRSNRADGRGPLTRARR